MKRPPTRRARAEDGTARALSALRRVVRRLRLEDKEAERSLGISVAQLYVLQLLGDGQPRAIVDLAEDTLTDVSSVSVVVRRLVERGLVVRLTDPRDARRALVHLTPEGRALMERAPEAPQMYLVEALRELPATRRHALADTLEELAIAMGGAEPTFFFEEEEGPVPLPPRRRPRGRAR